MAPERRPSTSQYVSSDQIHAAAGLILIEFIELSANFCICVQIIHRSGSMRLGTKCLIPTLALAAAACALATCSRCAVVSRGQPDILRPNKNQPLSWNCCYRGGSWFDHCTNASHNLASGAAACAAHSAEYEAILDRTKAILDSTQLMGVHSFGDGYSINTWEAWSVTSDVQDIPNFQISFFKIDSSRLSNPESRAFPSAGRELVGRPHGG